MIQRADPVEIDEPPVAGWPDLLTRAAFAIVIISVIARATMLETLRDPFEVSIGSQGGIPKGLGAAGSVVLDWIACAPALLIVLRRVIDGRWFRLRTSRTFLFLFPLAMWAALSPLWSADRFVAVVGVAHFVSATAICWATFQLVRTPTQRRLVVGACFGLFLVLIAHSLIYRYVELPDTQRSVESNWPQILAEHNWEPDSFLARQFHQKVMSGEMFGFSSSPNTLAAMLVMLGILAAGAIWQRIADRDQPAWPIAIALSFLLAALVLWHTQSKAAFVSPFLALAAFALIAQFASMMSRHRRAVFALSIASFCLAVLAVVGHGLYHDNLPTDSLNFRWKYWTGAAHLITHHKWLGVGWNNFGDAYLAFRRPEAAEEIRDPHNLFVHIASELGLIGLTLFLAWLLQLIWSMTLPIQRSHCLEIERDRSEETSRAAIKSVLILAIGAMVLNTLASVDFSLDIGWVFIEVMKRALFAALICVGIIVIAFRAVERAEIDNRPPPKIQVAGVIALLIFLLHNLIDFSLFESGPLFVFMFIAGALLADSNTARRERAKAPVVISGAVAAVIGWLAAGFGIAAPLVIAESKADDADDAMRSRHAAPAAVLLLDAYNVLPFSNADYLTRAALAQMAAGASPDAIRDTLHRAMSADPRASSYPRRLAEFELRLSPPDFARIREAFSTAIALNPNDVQVRLEYAQSLERAGDRASASREYLEAIQKNDLLDAAEPKRLRADERDRIENHARQLSAAN